MRPAIYDLGIFPVLQLTGEQVRMFTNADLEELRELGATDAMLGRLERLAREPGARFGLDFEHEAVTLLLGTLHRCDDFGARGTHHRGVRSTKHAD
jgi:hypothetical protein